MSAPVWKPIHTPYNHINVAAPKYRIVFMCPRRAGSSTIRGMVFSVIDRNFCKNYLTPSDVAELKAAGYLVVGVRRNSLDRLVSLWRGLIDRDGMPSTFTDHGLRDHMSFDECVRVIANEDDGRADTHWRSQVALLSHGGELLPDLWVRHEHRAEDWPVVVAEVLAQRGMQLPLEMRHENRSADHDKPWQSYYTDETFDLVRARYINDVSTWYRELL